jgi:CHASE2 domain-containing sensor protein
MIRAYEVYECRRLAALSSLQATIERRSPMFDALISGAMIMGVFALSYGIVRVAWWIFNDEKEE